MKTKFIPLICLFFSAFGVFAQDARPNIILVLVDDLGYSDLGSYGSEIETPNLDRLAKEGMRLQQFYNNSICAPTRASVITGQYQHTAGVGYFSNDLGLPAYQGYLNAESLTFAEVLKASGYQTLTSGKWHVSGKGKSAPWQRGFDKVYPQEAAMSGSGAPTFKEPRADVDGYPLAEDYATNLINKHAEGFLREAKQVDKPFFLYLAHTAPHWPLLALREDIAHYKGRYDKGWDAIRQQRFDKQKALHIIADTAALSTRDANLYDWNSLSSAEKQGWSRKMEVFAAMVHRLDISIGSLLHTLEANGQLSNTVIFFLSDNGAPAEDLRKWHLGNKTSTGPVGTVNSYESQSKNWSYASNTPFKAYKDYLYEGGINTPFIAWYPKKIKGNSIKEGVGHIIDLAPTIYALAEAQYPTQYQGVQSNPLPGKSLLPVLFNEEGRVQRDEGLFWERAGNRAARIGDWKLVSSWPSYTWELFDLKNDPTETKDVAASNPAIVRQLENAYFEWAKRVGVVDFKVLEDKEPEQMKKFRASKIQDIPTVNKIK